MKTKKTLHGRMSPLSLGSPERRRRVPYALYLFLTFSFITLQTFNSFSQGGAAINTTGASSDPSAMLDVSSTNQGMRIPRVALTSTTSTTPIANPANSLLVYDSVTTGDVTPGFYYWNTNKWTRLATGSGGWSTSGNAGTDTTANFIGTIDNKSLVVKTNNTERMKISKSGNIGIGTANPSTLLHLWTGNAGAQPPLDGTALTIESNLSTFLSFLAPSSKTCGIIFGDASTNARGTIRYFGSTSSYPDMMLFDTGGSVHMVISGNGNVGIATTSPEAKLHINQSIVSTPAIQVQHGDGTFMLFEESGGTDIWQINRLASTNNMEFNNVASGNFVFTGGNIGLGTTNPGQKLDVNGTIRTTAGSYSTDWYNSTNSTFITNNSGGNINFQTGGVTPLFVEYTGKVGIGTTSPASSAVLDISSSTKGMLIPRMATANRPASPATGLIIYNTDCNELQYSNGTTWVSVINTSSLVAPIATASHGATATQITANWIASSGATGYYLDVATDNAFNGILTNYNNLNVSNVTTCNLTGLTCGTTYYYRVRAYSSCGTSANSNTMTTLSCWSCGNALSITHTYASGGPAPVTKTINYETVLTGLSGASKCWITQNLGATNQATAVYDNTEASAGWYWQFNLKQGYKHDGTTRTPGTTWITSISGTNDWLAANDPCTIELGTGWHIPTSTELTNADANGAWDKHAEAYADVLKLHAAGYLTSANGSLSSRGTNGLYWSRTYNDTSTSWCLSFHTSTSSVGSSSKTVGLPVRCIKDN